MKQFGFILVALYAFFLLPACDSPASERAENDIEQAADSVSDVFEAERADLRDDLRDAKEDVDEELAELRARLATASDDAKVEINEKIARLEKQQEKLADNLNRFEENVENGWENFKREVRETLQEIDREI